MQESNYTTNNIMTEHIKINIKLVTRIQQKL